MKEETSFPTFVQESLMATFIINAIEGCNMAAVNISGAFIHTDMVHGDRIVRVRLCGVLADIMVKIDPTNFVEKVVLEDGKKVIYVVLKKYIYGALIASLLFWRDMSGELVYWGFKPNLYDSCVMKNMVYGRQCTI